MILNVCTQTTTKQRPWLDQAIILDALPILSSDAFVQDHRSPQILNVFRVDGPETLTAGEEHGNRVVASADCSGLDHSSLDESTIPRGRASNSAIVGR